ncbi:aspartyl-phosphate phosphatase Spo0E family protein [Bacillus cereus group sp. BfR-BA-01315]|uniref:aspartyl-phosphate phosphatase Spo0E family protein n=1 Tax=Bacillus cereus group sp. BfR-BA-01315 TaxID=2920292 RepID=UPI001F561A9D|nr:aspartyl-phosphate phosphatase Spo0E family protein [Bacillus cereus group sp. BfR-BA-01315]
MELTLLYSLIEDKKNELVQLAIKYGMNHEKVLLLSQELDDLIFRFMKNKIEFFYELSYTLYIFS